MSRTTFQMYSERALIFFISLAVAFYLLDGDATLGAEVVVVHGKGDRGPFVVAVQRALGKTGIELDTLKYTGVKDDALKAYKLAIFPYPAKMTPDEIDATKKFISAGGKVIAFYLLPKEIADLLGVWSVSYVPDNDEKKFYSVKFEGGDVGEKSEAALPGLPTEMVQNSWNIFSVLPLKDTKVIGRWQNPRGEDSGYPAVLLSSNGAFMSHVLTSDDMDAKAEFLRALIRHFIPEESKKPVQKMFADFGKIGKYKSVDEFIDELTGKADEGGANVEIALDRTTKALEQKEEAEGLLANRDYDGALKKIIEAKETLRSAYYPIFSSRDVELRGVFVSQPAPAPNWEEVSKRLKQSGFNAVFAFMSSAGIAHYESNVLPLSEGVKKGKDYLKECITSAHKEGLEVFAWHNCFDLTGAAQETIDAMQAANRLCRSADGKAHRMLCPTQPRNRECEIKACLEIVQNYAVDGIFLDYVRYPFAPPEQYCYCSSCRDTFQADEGIEIGRWPGDVLKGDLHEPFVAWGAKQISGFLGKLCAEVRKVKPDVKICPAIFGWPGARSNVRQDSAEWIKEGYIDLALYMNYTAKDDFFASLVKKEAAEVSNRAPLYVGIGAFSHAAQFESPIQLIDQIVISRKLGADGFVIFHLNQTLMDEFLPALREGVTAKDAKAPHRE